MRKAKIDLSKIEQEKEKQQNRKVRRGRALILLAVMVCLVIVSLFAGKWLKNRQEINALRSHFVQYDACSKDLNALAEYLLILYPDTETRPEYLLIASSDLVDESGDPIMIPTGIKTAIEAIQDKGFVSAKFNWRLISFHDGRVQFDTSDGNYALVYSPGGQPTYLHEDSEDFTILVEHIEGDWYHILRTG